MSWLLLELGHVIEVADTEKEAWELADKKHYAVIHSRKLGNSLASGYEIVEVSEED